MDTIVTGLRRKGTLVKPITLIAIGLLIVGWLLSTPPGLLGKADAIGYAVCHRIDLRSFHLGERTLPLCARCTGMHLGALLGLTFQYIIGRRRAGMPPTRVLIPTGFLAVAFALDGLNSFASLIPGIPTLYAPNNQLRLLTGTGMGIAIACLLFPSFNQTIWKNWQPQASLGGILNFGLLLMLALVLDLVVLSGNPLVMYPLALLSALGVLVELTLVYSMLVTMLFRKENLATRLNQLWLPISAGFGLGLLQIASLDLLRYILTGTWDGFHLG